MKRRETPTGFPIAPATGSCPWAGRAHRDRGIVNVLVIRKRAGGPSTVLAFLTAHRYLDRPEKILAEDLRPRSSGATAGQTPIDHSLARGTDRSNGRRQWDNGTMGRSLEARARAQELRAMDPSPTTARSHPVTALVHRAAERDGKGALEGALGVLPTPRPETSGRTQPGRDRTKARDAR